MYILGISDSHESHASLIKNGKLIAWLAEERLNRIKGFAGYPKLAIDKVLKIETFHLEIRTCCLQVLMLDYFTFLLNHLVYGNQKIDKSAL